MTPLNELTSLPLAEFTAEVSRQHLPAGDLRAAIFLVNHKIGSEQYGKNVVQAGAPVWDELIRRAQHKGDKSPVEAGSDVASLAWMLLRRFEPDDNILFLSPSRVAERVYAVLPLSLREVSSLVPVADLAALAAADFNTLRDLRRVKNLMTPAVGVFAQAGVADKEIDRWSTILPLIP